jgi:hypothetical protein
MDKEFEFEPVKDHVHLVEATASVAREYMGMIEQKNRVI